MFLVPPFEEAREVEDRLETEVRFVVLLPVAIPWFEREERLPILRVEDIGLKKCTENSELHLLLFQILN